MNLMLFHMTFLSAAFSHKTECSLKSNNSFAQCCQVPILFHLLFSKIAWKYWKCRISSMAYVGFNVSLKKNPQETSLPFQNKRARPLCLWLAGSQCLGWSEGSVTFVHLGKCLLFLLYVNTPYTAKQLWNTGLFDKRKTWKLTIGKYRKQLGRGEMLDLKLLQKIM